MSRLAIILHSGSLHPERADEADTLVQVRELSALMTGLGWEARALSYEQEETEVIRTMLSSTPAVVVNLVESAGGSDAESYRAPQLLDRLGLPYTGASTRCLRDCGGKSQLKARLIAAGIPTPAWVTADSNEPTPAGRYIVKSETEHGSLGLDASCVVAAAEVRHTIARLAERHGGAWFAEQFIDGREFNVSLLADGERVKVLPVAEISFDGLPTALPRIVDYAAKWDETSLTCRHTSRLFPDEPEPCARMADLARRCWDACGLKGYARVDFRTGADGTPYVIDVNPNPCLSADAGFLAAAAQAGLSPLHVMQRILDDAFDRAPAFMG